MEIENHDHNRNKEPHHIDSPTDITIAAVTTCARAIIATLACGLAAGLACSVPCFLFAVPLIKEAEEFEGDDGLLDGFTNEVFLDEDDDAWAPTERARDWCTLVSNIWVGVAYAALLLSVALVRAAPLNAQIGLKLGAIGLVAFQLAPALGGAPELPATLAAPPPTRHTIAARAAPRLARTAPESALDEPAGAARAPRKLAHRLHAAVDSLVNGGQSRDCRSKPAGFVTPFTRSALASLFLLGWFFFFFCDG